MTNTALFRFEEKLYRYTHDILERFNKKGIKLTEIPAHKRIFIFFLTRTIKTYNAARKLCYEGYAQDIATLLRSMLENLVSVKYILADSPTADEKAERFVDYKWIVFRRYISNFKSDDPEQTKDLLMKKLITKRGTINEKVQLFREKYKIKSDKALITWSGKTLRDMAKMCDSKLLDEYDSTYRLSSRFSHPSIIGDSAYIKYVGHNMIFSTAPSEMSVDINLRIALLYILEFISALNKLFQLNEDDKIAAYQEELSSIPSEEPKNIHSQTAADLDKDKIKIQFQTSKE